MQLCGRCRALRAAVCAEPCPRWRRRGVSLRHFAPREGRESGLHECAAQAAPPLTILGTLFP
eukprot:6491017-Lingulodinium_polyedra.AAC.1